MIDDQQAVPEQIVQDEPVPSSEPTETPDAGDEVDELPEGVTERTKEQFNKLKEANQALKKQLEKKESVEPIFEAMRPKTPQGLTQGQLDQVTDVDPLTGNKFINEDKLSSFLSQHAQKAEQAVAQVNQFLEEQQTREAFTAIPQLNPKATDFDPELHKATRAYILDSMINPQDYDGRQLTYKEAGQMAKKATNAEIAKVEAEASAQMQAKEQSSLEAAGRSDRRSQVNTSEEERRQRIRQGDEDALASYFEET